MRHRNWLRGTVVVAALATSLAISRAGWSGDAPPAHDHQHSSDSGRDPAERLRALDTNHDGKLDPQELSPQTRTFIEGRLGLKLDKPMSIDELARIARERRSSSGHSHPEGDRNRSDSKAAPKMESLVPGFGTADQPVPPAFGLAAELLPGSSKPLEQRYDKKVLEIVDGMLRKYDKNGNGVLDQVEWNDVQWRGDPKLSDLNHDGRLTRAELCERIAKLQAADKAREQQKNNPEKKTTTTTAGSGGGSGNAAATARLRTYAESLLRQYDENKSGRLERDEWSKMRGSWQEADRNNDGMLTVDEIANHLARLGRGPSGSGHSGTGGLPRSYRFVPATERLPSGLPTWFTRDDQDGDGQVTMAEFATTWDAAKLAEFAKYDLNGDGVVTARECLTAEKTRPAKP